MIQRSACAANPEKFVIVLRQRCGRHYAENDVPQPQLFFACGFSKTKPDCISDPSSRASCRREYTMLLGSMKTFTSSNCEHVVRGARLRIELELIAQARAAAAQHAQTQVRP